MAEKDHGHHSHHDDSDLRTKKITAEKKDDTDSTTTVTTATATSVCILEWDNDITEVLAEITALNDQIYVFEKNDG